MTSAANQTVVRLKDFRAGDVGNQVSSALNSIAGQLADGVQKWSSRARATGKSADAFVRSNPWQAIGAIAIAGLAAGVLVTRAAARTRRASLPRGSVSASEMSGG